MRAFRTFLVVVIPMLPVAASAATDPTEAALARCANAPANASTAGQTECEAKAARSYDRRLNAAYQALLERLPPLAGQRLRETQRTWLGFRAADARARAALYATRRGTIYVPMQAASETRILRDRTLQLESYLRVMTIDD